MNVQCDVTHITDEYDIFKSLFGNRNLRPSNVKQLTIKMVNNGWVGGPIIVNENMEVIDGQNRIEAARNAGIKVEYLIKKGYGIRECILLNAVSAKWSCEDYVVSFAKQGVDSYIWLLNLKKKYPCFSFIDLFGLCAHEGKNIQLPESKKRVYIDGGLDIDAAGRKVIEDICKRLAKYHDAIKQLGRRVMSNNAILFCLHSAQVNEQKFYDRVFIQYKGKLENRKSVKGYIELFEEIYNYNVPKQNNVHLLREYLNFQSLTYDKDVVKTESKS